MASLAHDTQWMDATAQAELVRKKQVTPRELLEAALERTEQLNPAINAVNYVWAERARDAARDLETAPDSPFRGVPFILKDLHAALEGTPMSNGNRALRAANYVADYSSELVRRFVASGLNIFGRGASPEFGSVPVTEPEAWGPTRSPYDLSRTSGGSSGGSAAAVAAGIVPAAHASDGGGSIRIPASCCGLVGLKVSQGRISMAPNRDETNLGVENVVTRTVRDCAAMLDISHGPGIGDRVIAPRPTRPYVDELRAAPSSLRIGFLDHRPLPGPLDSECAIGVQRVVETLSALGHRVEASWPKPLEDPSIPPRFSALWSTNMAVAIEATARLLGRPADASDYEAMNWAMATFAGSMSAVDYAKSVVAMTAFRRSIQQWWADGFDLLVTPTLAQLPLPIGSICNNPDSPMDPMRVAGDFVAFTTAYNVSGQPAISLPLHWTPDGVPVGIQLVAGYGREDLLISVAAQLEEAMPWRDRRPVTGDVA
ncbi:MAG: amidase [Actinobacteria bacterium]|nr:amidase [Actinomycetota bacterium]